MNGMLHLPRIGSLAIRTEILVEKFQFYISLRTMFVQNLNFHVLNLNKCKTPGGITPWEMINCNAPTLPLSILN